MAGKTCSMCKNLGTKMHTEFKDSKRVLVWLERSMSWGMVRDKVEKAGRTQLISWEAV